MVSIGRSVDCNVVIDSATVAAHHALVSLKGGAPMVFDLGSEGGVFVNDQRIRSECPLVDGDRIRVGDAELRVVRGVPSQRLASRAAETVPGYGAHQPSETLKSASSEDRALVDAVQLMSEVAEQLIESGDAKKAVKMLGSRLVSVLEVVRAGRLTDPKTIESSAYAALRLAGAAQDAAWVNYVILLYDAVGEVMPRGVIEVLHAVVPRAQPLQLGILRGYLNRMRESKTSNEDKFLLQRLSSIERVVAGR
jgi:predicted component of type VI protein secretion system